MKSTLAVVCYVLAGVGVFLALLGSMVLPVLGRFWPFILIAWIAAAIAHQRLVLAWIDGRRMGVRAAIVASVLGVIGLLAFPIAPYFKKFRFEAPPPVFYQVIGIELLSVLPAFLLAVYLTWYHASRTAPNPSIERTASGKPEAAAHVER